jgi:hypothetical protein
MTIGPHLLGRIVNHDPRSRAYTVSRRVIKPRNTSWENDAAILDQGEIGSCVGNTGAEWLNSKVCSVNRSHGTLPGWRTKALRHAGSSRYDHHLVNEPATTYMHEQQAVALYSLATQLDDAIEDTYPPDDCGTSGLGLAKAMRQQGFIYGFDWTFDFESFLAALQHSPVCVGINWTDGMMDPDSKGFVVDTGSVSGGHEILARAVNFTQKYVTFRNHWGKSWGVKGECKMSFDVVERLLAQEGDVMVPRIMAS